MIKKLFIVGIAVAASLWIGQYIQSYNHSKTMSVQQRFDSIVAQANDKAKGLLNEADKKKQEAIDVIKEKRDVFLQQQQKRLFNQ